MLMGMLFPGRPSIASGYSKKILIVALLLPMLVLGHLAKAQDQPLGEQKVTVKVQNASLGEVFRILRRQVKLQFVMDAGVSEKSGNIQLNMVNVPLSDVLNSLFSSRGMEYVINKNVVVIRKVNTPKIQDSTGRTLLLKVSVLVKNEDGAFLPGATVAVPGETFKSGITDSKGQLAMSVSPTARLRVSFIGYEPQQVTVNGRQQIDVVLKLAQKMQDEIVITGYQNLHQWESVGSTVKVKGEDVLIAGVPRVDIALQGMIPGVSITIPNGTVGANPKVRVRGTSTLLGNREPVWVVDGIIRQDPFPFTDQNLDNILNATDKASMQAGLSIMSNGIAGLNPDDIEDITFLKDASATALYGVSAANGVIVITTKRGKAGRTDINFRSDLSVTERPNYNSLHLMNSAQRVALSEELIAKGVNYSAPNFSGTPPVGTYYNGPQNIGYEGLYYQYINKQITQQQFNDGVTRLELNNTDWFKALFRNAINQNYTLSVSGGTDKATFYGSFGYNTTANSARGNSQTRTNALMNMDYRLNPKIKWHVSVDAEDLQTVGFYEGVNPAQYALSANRELTPDQFYALGDASTNIALANGNTSTFLSHLQYNFENELAHTGNTVDSKRFNFNTDLQINLTHELNLQAIYSDNFDRSTKRRWADEQSYAVALIRGANYDELPKGSAFEQASVLAHGGVLEREQMNRDGYLGRVLLNYNKSLGGHLQHNLNFMAGGEASNNTYTGDATKNYGYFPDRGDVVDYDYSIIHNASDVFANKYYDRRTNTLTNLLSYFTSLTYSYKHKYTINLNGRNDASNRFGQYTNASFNPVWAIGARWDILAEKWFEHRLTWINTLTVRSSFGFQGNIVDEVGPNLIAQYTTPTFNPITGESYLSIKSMPYPDLHKEKTRTTNIGVDLSFLKNRVSVTFDYYHKYSRDLISLRNTPLEYGTTQMYVNGSDMVNEGLDLAVRVVPVKTRDLTWTLQFNASMNRNDVIKPQYSPNLQTLTNGTALVNGYPVDGFWSFRFAGLNHTTGRPMFKYLDVDTNLTLLKNPDATQYLTYSGNSTPRIYGGLNTSVMYKNITVAAMFNVELDYKLRLNPIMLAGTNGQYQAPAPDKNASLQLINRWEKPGDEQHTTIPAIYANDESPSYLFNDPSIATPNITSWYRYTMYNYSDLRVVDGSHLRCNNIAVSYNFTRPQLAKLKGLTRLILSANLTNPFIIADKRLMGQDPEILTTNANTVTPTMPRMRTATFSLNVGF